MSYNKAKQAYSVWGAWIDPAQFLQKEFSLKDSDSKKVIVSQETADAQQYVFSSEKKGQITKYRMIQACTQKIWGEAADVLNKMSPETMLDILLNGYEVELSPQQKVEQGAKKAHDSFAVTCDTANDFYAYRSGMRDALAILGYNFNWLNLSKDVDSHTIKVDKPAKH